MNGRQHGAVHYLASLSLYYYSLGPFYHTYAATPPLNHLLFLTLLFYSPHSLFNVFFFFLSFFLSLVCSFSCFAENLSSFLFLFLHLSHTDYSILVPMDSLVLIFCLFRRRSDSCCTEKSCNLFLKNYYTGFYVYRYIYIKFVNIT